MTSWSVHHEPIPWYPASPSKSLPLGRNYKWDTRSAAYPYQAEFEQASLADQLWERMIAILDQGNVGSCTGNAETGECGTAPFFATMPAGVVLDETMALAIYSGAEVIDGDGPYPPNDNGSSGSSACQSAKNLGLISGYTHANTVTQMADALQKRPLIVGVNWYDSFDSPGPNGLISISPNASVRGGHEFLIRGVKITERLFLADNSWGPDWGDAGSMELSWDTMTRLLGEQGDCTVSVPLTAPAPTPVPVPANPDTTLWQAVEPWCAHPHTRPDLVALKSELQTWAHAKGF